VPLCPPQIPHELKRARTRASAVRGRRPMARPHGIFLPHIYVCIVPSNRPCIITRF
jgi:hypothetical protein